MSKWTYLKLWIKLKWNRIFKKKHKMDIFIYEDD